jgi:hypothetical protein
VIAVHIDTTWFWGEEFIMYTLIRTLPLQRLLIEQGIPFGIAFIVAELFYKFHSFTLECLAFLATWFILDFVVQVIRARLMPNTVSHQPPH